MNNFSKDFDTWNELKKNLHMRDEEILFHEREIWWCSMGINIGFEEDGKNQFFERPALIVKKFSRDVLWVLPLTRSNKINKYHYRILQGSEQDSVVILSQLRLISNKRLLRKMRMITELEFKEITGKVKNFLE